MNLPKLDGLRYRLRALVHRHAIERQLAEELEHHAAVRGPFPDSEAVAEACRDSRGTAGLENLARDFRHAVRSLRKLPAFTLPAVCTLALGMGSAVAIYSVAYALVLNPLNYPQAKRLVEVYEYARSNGLSAGNYDFPTPDLGMLQADGKAFASFGVAQATAFDLTGTGAARRVRAGRISSGLLPTLGVAPALGREFSPTEEGIGHNVAILSDDLWRSTFHRDPRVLGQQVDLDGKPFTVVGVMPRGFAYPPPGQFGTAADQVFVPLALTAREEAEEQFFAWSVVGRLAPGATLASAGARAAAMGQAVRQRWLSHHVAGPDLTLNLRLARLDAVAAKGSETLAELLMGAAGLLLALSVANAANMFLVRANARRHEWALRASLGAGRARLATQSLAEALVLTGTAAAAGTLFAWGAIRAMAALAPATLPQLGGLRLPPSALAVAACLVLLVGPVVGTLATQSATRVEGLSVLLPTLARGGGRRGRPGWRRALVVLQVAIAFVLACGAGLLIHSLRSAVAEGAGVATGGRVTATAYFPAVRYSSQAQVAAFFRGIQSNAPGSEQWALSTALPPSILWHRSMSVEGQAEPKGKFAEMAAETAILGPYFSTLGIPILQGRGFSPAEDWGGAKVIVVSASLAARNLPRQSWLGKRVSISGEWLRVVGVVGDVKARGVDAPAGVQLYVPYADACGGRFIRFVCANLHLTLDSRLGAAAATQSLRSAVAARDALVPLSGVQTLEDEVGAALAARRFNVTLIAFFGVTALALAGVGLFSVLAYLASERRQELAIRMALGARAGQVLAAFLRQGLVWSLEGLALGMAGAWCATGVIASMLYKTPALNPGTWLATAALLAAVAVGASVLPAVRAGRIDPQQVLRQG